VNGSGSQCYVFWDQCHSSNVGCIKHNVRTRVHAFLKECHFALWGGFRLDSLLTVMGRDS